MTALRTGTRLGPYEVLGVIGAGGMGEVYRARDTNLQRDVAIKVLPAAMAANQKRLLRFEREARALAALNHPNIATVYGIEVPAPDAGHGRALVMELVEGEDLSWRLGRGALPIADALSIARQVADALAAAHEAGIVHRDLKPANIKVREDGTVKVLDFGLATGGTADSGAGAEPEAGPDRLPHTVTLAGHVTEDGTVLGTAAYMAPEQAMGARVDKRADIWAFGIVLFEMLAGRRPFEALNATDGRTRVVVGDQVWKLLPSDTPSSVRRLLARCLAWDVRLRLHDLADARLEIDDALAPEAPPAPWGDPTGARLRRTRVSRWLMLAAPGLLAGIAIGAAVWRTPAPGLPVAYVRIGLEPAAELHSSGLHASVVLPAAGARTALAWSPGGQALAFIGMEDGVRRVYLRELTSETASPLAGTEGARALTFSPDGYEVAFWADGALRRIKITGGPSAKICNSKTMNGLTWGDTRIVYAEAPNLFEVSPAGGTPRQITSPPELVRHALPLLLPGEQALLYTEHEKQWTSGDERVMIQPLAPGAPARVLLREAADARYLATGHLAFLRQGTLFVVPFDVRTLQLRGEPVAVLNGVAQAAVAWDSDDLTLAGQFAISPAGTLAYVARPLAAYPDRELVAIDRHGNITPIGAPVRGYRNRVAVSPDGSRIAVSVQAPTGIRPFAYDLRRGSLSRLAESLKGEVIVAAWSNQDRIAVQVIDAGRITAAIIRPDVASPAVQVADSTGFWASSLTPEGHLAGMKGGDVWIYPPNASEGPAVELLATSDPETQPVWSPDGRWIAYTSDTTGRPEIYLRPFPGPGEATTISVDGGCSPAWNPRGGELFYIEAGEHGDRMMVVNTARPDHPGKPTELFTLPRNGLALGSAVLTPYAVDPGGQRFYAVRQQPLTSAPVTEVNVVLNWFAGPASRFLAASGSSAERRPPVQKR